jgi:lactate 2-monooxygenase
VQPALPITFDDLEALTAQAFSPAEWSYVAGGAGDEATQRADAQSRGGRGRGGAGITHT